MKIELKESNVKPVTFAIYWPHIEEWFDHLLNAFHPTRTSSCEYERPEEAHARAVQIIEELGRSTQLKICRSDERP